MYLFLYLRAAGKIWWGTMSCAVFTFIGGYAAYANKDNTWIVGALFSTSFILTIVSGFLAWKEKEKECEGLRAKLSVLEASAHVPQVQNIYFPAPPVPSKPEPLKHNVQCLGVEITPDFPLILMCFRNIEIPGKPVGLFKAARLKVTFYLESSGEEVAEIFPVKWSGFPDQDEIEIGVKKVCAILAMHSLDSDLGWEAHSTKGIPAEIGWKYILERTFLPSDRLKVVANLIGEDNLSMDKPIEGILTLGEDRSASWTLTE
jgi:hypothetical protein